MRKNGSSLRKKGLMALIAITSLVMITADPALAAQTVAGAGGGSGWEYPSAAFAPCDPNDPGFGPAEVGPATFELLHTGTYSGANSAGVQIALFTGLTKVTIGVAAHVISPAGAGPDCAVPLGPVPITSMRVESVPPISGSTGGVDCTLNSGTYTRVSSAVNFTSTGTCTVKGNTGLLTANVTASPTAHTITGTMNPCAVPPFFIENPECTAAYNGTTTPPGPPVARDANGDPLAGSHLVTTYQAGGAQP